MNQREFLYLAEASGRRPGLRRHLGWLVALLQGVATAVTILLGTSGAWGDTPPTFSKSFAPDTIGAGSTTTLTFTIENDSATAISGLSFQDTLPPGIVIATPASLSTDCRGTVTAAAGGNIITLTEGVVAGNGQCTISVNVTSSSFGTHSNISGDLISDAGNSGAATATLTVADDVPGFSKSFSPSQVALGGRSRLTFTIDNSANDSALVYLIFSDNLSVGMEVADPPNAVSTCGGLITAVPGSGAISLAPDLSPLGVAAGGICTVSVDVVATGVGSLHNVSGELTSANPMFIEASSGFATATLEVTADDIILIKRFVNDPVPAGGTVELQYTLINRSRDEVATDISFTDDLSQALPGLVSVSQNQSGVCGAGSFLTGASLVNLSGGSLAPGASCTFSVQVMVPGASPPGGYPSATSPVQAVIAGNPVQGAPGTDSLFVSAVPIFTKEFIDDPVTAGGRVSMRYTITNTSTQFDALDIAFVDELPGELVSIWSLPAPGFCGVESAIDFWPRDDFDPSRIIVNGARLNPGDTCFFDVVFDVSEGASSGDIPSTTEPLTAEIDGVTVTAPPASDDLRIIAGPQLTTEFIGGSVLPGGTTTLRFTIAHSEEAPGPATNIRFFDDLDAVIPGMTAINLPQSDICGVNSLLSGQSVIDFASGLLNPGQTCSFDVQVLIPAGAPFGVATNTTSIVTSSILGQQIASSPATADLLISPLTFTKTILGNPVIPGDTATIEFTITNQGSEQATGITFSDDLDEALPGLTSLTPTQMDICGSGSSISGSNLLMFQGGSLAANSSCTFSVEVLVPPGTVEGEYIIASSEHTAMVDGTMVTLPAATAVLSVTNTLLAIEKTFETNPVMAGEPSGLRFTLTNLDPARPIDNIAFTDVLQGGLVGSGGVQSDICGLGSQISGLSTLSFTGGSLAPGASCAFTVPVLTPENGGQELIENTTSEMTGTIGSFAVRGDPASDSLALIYPATFEQSVKITRNSLRLDGSFLIEFPGIRGETYCVQVSENLVNWITFETEFIGSDETIEFIDNSPPTGGRVFYRVIQKE